MSGERRLLLALLLDAINVYQKGAFSRVARDRLLCVDAERWFMQSRAAKSPLSFETVCEGLGIDARALRRRMIAWKHETQRQLQIAPGRSLRRWRSLKAPERGPEDFVAGMYWSRLLLTTEMPTHDRERIIR